jgi:hypothetical protein
VICAAFADPAMRASPQPFFYLTCDSNGQPILLANILMLLLAISTAICDWRIFLLNRRIRSRANPRGYSLSRNYQLNENALVMRLILPLDVAYALLYSLYIASTMLIRAYKPLLSFGDYIFLYNLADTVSLADSLTMPGCPKFRDRFFGIETSGLIFWDRIFRTEISGSNYRDRLIGTEFSGSSFRDRNLGTVFSICIPANNHKISMLN